MGVGSLLDVTSVGILRGRPRGCRSPAGGIMGNIENRPSGKPQSVLFVCTGNIFRSVTAEYALKARLGTDTSYVVSSAGIDAKAQSMHEWVLARLREKGADPTSHVQRQLTEELIEAADFIIAMGRNHQAYIREEYGQDVPLFNQICLGHDKPILDLHEAIPDWETDPERARAYVCSVIDTIWTTAPALLSRLR
ncbi:MAG: low molecular weight phosphatase family protein [Nitrospira sp. CG24C]|nr:MAG: low molecular weight phosphatase family protein [Nitrospira sp. CG24C]TKB52456.1 MAG: low molecular weight phosphatase family protein [Nitrospira sp.]